ncbi:hypothetical protein CPB86DRAFT_783192 [Serendipita vermifera]|nr:hypothetical protein CPB86DRAFT_783192 [Serendipita vermifera]
MPNIVELAQQFQASNFAKRRLPDTFVNHEAIIAKLSYEIMDPSGSESRWGLVYSGNHYIIFLVIPIIVGNLRRCEVVSSNILTINDKRRPYIALMLYMLLSSYQSHQELATSLQVSASRRASICSPEQLDNLLVLP